MCTGCTSLWYSKLQNDIALRTSEAEYTALGQAMCDILTFMALLK